MDSSIKKYLIGFEGCGRRNGNSARPGRSSIRAVRDDTVEKTALLTRARTNRKLTDKTKLFSCLNGQSAAGSYELMVQAKGKRKKGQQP